MSWDIDAIRAQFPSLHHRVNDQSQVYFDNPAGTQVPQRVIDAVSNYYLNMNANQGGVFRTSMATSTRCGGKKSSRGRGSPSGVAISWIGRLVCRVPPQGALRWSKTTSSRTLKLWTTHVSSMIPQPTSRVWQ